MYEVNAASTRRWITCNRYHDITLLGKNMVIKSLIVPNINQVIANITTPEWFVKKVQEIILNFLWNNKPPKM